MLPIPPLNRCGICAITGKIDNRRCHPTQFAGAIRPGRIGGYALGAAMTCSRTAGEVAPGKGGCAAGGEAFIAALKGVEEVIIRLITGRCADLVINGNENVMCVVCAGRGHSFHERIITTRNRIRCEGVCSILNQLDLVITGERIRVDGLIKAGGRNLNGSIERIAVGAEPFHAAIIHSTRNE